jgi:hypothetical protein
MLAMRQHGAWWKGLTDDGLEISVSHAHFVDILVKQKDTQVAHPEHVERIQLFYSGVELACYHPEWWRDVYLINQFAIGPWQFSWVRRKGYDKLILGEATQLGYSSNIVGTRGTIIFKQLSKQSVSRLLAFEEMIKSMYQAVTGYFEENFGVLEVTIPGVSLQ